MRKWMVLFVWTICLWACDDEQSNDQIQMSSDVANFEQGGGEISILIKATADWNVAVMDDWCFVQPDKEKGSFFVIASENESAVPRMTVLSVVAGNCVKEVDVIQAGSGESKFSLSENEANVYDLNDNYAVVVHSDVAWNATKAGNWFTIEPESGEAGVTLVRVQFSQNKLNVERQGMIAFETKNGDVQEFRLKQEVALPDSRYQDSLALVALYDACQGDHFEGDGVFKNWKKGNLDTWEGVVLKEGRVSTLRLVQVGQGYLPEDIKYLSCLEELYLKGSGLGGSIPRGLGRCVNLSYCVFGDESYSSAGSNMTGALPNSLCALRRLQTFTCYNTRIGGELPEVYGNLSNLKNLTLEGNALTGALPVAWKYLVQIYSLYLSGNALVGEFPEEWGIWENIWVLDLSKNEGLYGVLPSELVATTAANGGNVIIYGTNIVNK